MQPAIEQTDPAANAMLHLDDIEVIYEKVAIKHISLQIEPPAIVALLGANGAGKSTILKAISGLIPAQRGEVVQDNIFYQGQYVTQSMPAQLVSRGLGLEGLHCLGHLTVEKNLLTAFVRRLSAKVLS